MGDRSRYEKRTFAGITEAQPPSAAGVAPEQFEETVRLRMQVLDLLGKLEAADARAREIPEGFSLSGKPKKDLAAIINALTEQPLFGFFQGKEVVASARTRKAQTVFYFEGLARLLGG